MKVLSLILCSTSLVLAPHFATATTPCPWQDTENSAACVQWEIMARRLEAAEARADAAEKALQSMDKALQSMEQALQNLSSPASQNQAVISTDPVDGDDADQVRALIDQALAKLDQQLDYQPGTLIYSKDYPLQPDGEGYRAEFAEFAFEAEDIRIDLAPVVVHITIQSDSLVQISGQLSDSITVSEAGETMVRINIGSQTASGFWSEQIQNFAEYTFDFGDINVTVTDEEGALSVGRFAGSQQLAVDDSDRWQQNQALAIESVAFDSGSGQNVQLANLMGEGTVTGVQYSKMMSAAQDIQKLAEEAAANLESENLENLEQLPASMMQYISDLLGSFKQYEMQFNATGLSVSDQNNVLAKIGEVGMSSYYDATSEQGASLGFSVGIDQFSSSQAPLPPGFTPHQARTEFALNNIPPNVFAQFIEMAMASEDIPPEQQDFYWQQQLFSLLMSSQLELKIIDTFIAAEEARADLNLRAAVDATSAMGGVAELDLRIIGMQSLIDMTGAEQDESVAPVLAMLTAFSERTEQDGKTVDSFILQFTPEGKLLLNSKDVTAMFMPGLGQ